MQSATRTSKATSPIKENKIGYGNKRKLDSAESSSNNHQQRSLKRSHVKGGGRSSSISESPMKNNDYCATCGLYGRFICCDACPKSFHFTCVEPPMEVSDVQHMKGDWYCRECEYQRRHHLDDTSKMKDDTDDPQPSQGPAALLKKMTEDLKSKNPTAYRLPPEITHYFKGVSMGEAGQYVDTSIIKKAPQKAGGLDDRRLKDKDGNFIYCFRCRKTALHKSIISCDYCPLHWHMDCLDPPMVYPPSPTRKWMCPNHPDHIMPRIRQRRNADIIDAVPSQPNNGIVTIVDDESWSFDGDDDDDLKGQNNRPSTPTDPDYEANSIIKYSDVVYRLPASSVKLDFLSHAASLRARQRIHMEDTHPSKEELRAWLEGLSCFQAQIASFVEKDLQSISSESGLNMLARASSLSSMSSSSNKNNTCSTCGAVVNNKRKGSE